MTAREEAGEWRGYPAYSSPYYIPRYRSHQQHNPRRDGKEAGEEAGGEKPEWNWRNVVTRPRWESTPPPSTNRPTYESRPLARAREGIASYSCKAVLLVVSVLLMAGIITALIVIGINIDPKQTMASRFSLARVKNRGMGSDRFEGEGDVSKEEQERMRAVVRDYAPYDYRDSIGAVMEGRDKTDLVQVVTAKVGYPAKSMRMVISFSSHLSYVPLAVVAESTTYVTKEYMVMSSSSNGSSASAYSINTKYGSDIVSLAGLTMRVPITCDDSAYSEILTGLCKDCQGVLGLGASSPFWMIWSMVRVGAGPLPIDIEIGDQLEREKARGRASMCIAFPWAQELAAHRLPPSSIDTSYDRKMEFETFTGQNSDYRLSLIPVMGNKDEPLCMVQAYVFGDEYLVDLSFSGMRTILPSKVYWKFVGENSISSTTTKMAKRSEARETQSPEEYDEIVFKAVEPRDGDEDQMQRYYSRNRRGKRNSDGSRPPPPPSLSKDFSGKRSHQKHHQDGDLEWRDLVIDFVTTDGNGSSSSSRNSVRIRMKDLIVHKSRSTDANPTSVDLLLIPDDGPLTAYGNVIRLGRSTMYSISADVYPGRGIAVVDQWFINRNWSPIDLMVMFVFVIMFIRWPMTRNRINGKLVRRHRPSKQSNRSRYYPLALVLWVKKIFLIGDGWVIQFDEQQSDARNDKRHHRYKFESFYVIGKRNMYIKMMIEVLTTFALIGVYASSETQHAISPFEAFDIYVLIAMITLIAIEYATVLFTVALDKVHWISGITEYEDAPRTLPYRPSDRDDGQAPVEEGNPHPPIFMHEAQLKRLSVMRNFCHQCVTVFILWLVLLHVREQTLATVSSLVASSALFFVAVYFTIIVLVSPVKPFAWMWGVFVSYQLLFLIYTAFICEVYVLRYFIEDVVYNRNPSLLIVMSIAFYTAIATLAAWTYRVSCNDDEYTQLVKEDARMGEMVLEKKPQTNNKS